MTEEQLDQRTTAWTTSCNRTCSVGKIDNVIVIVHLSVRKGRHHTLIDNEVFLPEGGTGLAICPGIWRKLSFSSQSPGGSRFVETMLTVIENCRQHSRNVFEYVTLAIQAHYSHPTTPSLISKP